MEGELRESWNDIAIRVTDAAVTPDMRRLVAVGMGYNPPPALARANVRDASPPIVSNGNGNAVVPRSPENRMIIYDLKTGQVELYVSSIFVPTSLLIDLYTQICSQGG
jgi:hypothetical protein